MQKKLIDTLLIALFAAAALHTAEETTQQEIQVVDVADGDTVDVLRGREKSTVRLLGIDTPETYKKNTPSEFFLKNTSKNRKCLQQIGEKATQLVKQKIGNQEVKIVQDPKSDTRGSYGRLLAYIQHNRIDIGKKLLKQGYARVYNSSFTRKEEYRAIERESRRQNEGIWNESCGSR